MRGRLGLFLHGNAERVFGLTGSHPAA